MKKIFTSIVIIVASISLLSAGCSIKKVDNNSQTNQSSAIAYQGRQGASALQLLKEKYRVETQSYPTGEFVKSINGVTPDATHFWALYVDGKQATVGASQYITKNGENIEWKLDQINSGL